MKAGTCNRCGRPIIWTKRLDDPNRWNRPLDPGNAHTGLVIRPNDTAEWVTVYQHHTCLAVDVREYSALMQALEDAPPPKRVTELDEGQRVQRKVALGKRNHESSPVKEGVHVNALLVACQRCGQEAGLECVNMSRGKNEGNPVLHAHRTRVMDAYNKAMGKGD